MEETKKYGIPGTPTCQKNNPRTWQIAIFLVLALASTIRILYLAAAHNDILLRHIITSDIFDQYRFMKPVLEIINGNWLGPKTFYSLSYSYTIALLYLLFPKDISTVFAFQVILGITAVYVSYRAARLLFKNKAVGFIAAFIISLYAPLVFKECDIERGAIIAYTNLFCFYFLLKALKKVKVKYFFLSGLILGFSMVIRPNILPFFIVPYIFFAVKKSFKTKIFSILIFVLGIMLLVTPFGLRNMKLGQGFTIEPQGIEAFWIGNAHDSPGIDLDLLDSQKQLAKESGNNIFKAMKILYREIKKYPSDYAHLYSRKIKMFFNGYEVPANLNFYLFKERYWVLNICVFNFVIIAPLALTGIFIARRKYNLIGLLYIFLAVISASNIIFHIQARYRIPAIPFFIIMAAYTVSWLFEMVKKLRLPTKKDFVFTGSITKDLAIIWAIIKNLTLACLVILLIGLISLYTRPDYPMIRKYSGSIIRNVDYGNLASAYLSNANKKDIPESKKRYYLKKSAEYFTKAIDTNPSIIFYYFPLGQVYYYLGKYETSKKVFSAILRKDPANPVALKYINHINKKNPATKK